ncbi:putative mediator of RNA polymerase II transcription subunit 26b isoform X2 [Tasmannia lanceolata]
MDMDMKSSTLDHWRKYFHSADSDIFEVIECGIMVAASDCPKEFLMRRDGIAEKLFSSHLTRCFGCNRIELVVPKEDDNKIKEGGFGGDGGSEGAGFGGKESKVNSSTTDREELNHVSNCSYDVAEELTNEIEEQSQIIGEVLRIKAVLSNYQDESDGALFESLRRLQLMELSVETLKATEIGKAVNNMRKQGSKQIGHLARALIDGWKVVVDEWVKTAAAIAGDSPESVNPSVVDDEDGLPSPPLDDLAFFTTSMDFSQFFDGMDDDGNFRSSGDVDKNRENGRIPTSENHHPKRKQQSPHDASVPKEDKSLMKKPEAVEKQTKPSKAHSGPGRPPKLSLEHKANGDTMLQRQSDLIPVQKKPLSDKSKYSDELSVQVKLEASKRKLQEGYKQAENVKKQRTVQVMELRDLPKNVGSGHRNSHPKPGTQNRRLANGRR